MLARPAMIFWRFPLQLDRLPLGNDLVEPQAIEGQGRLAL
jgi:hypothetical protein